MKKFLVGMLFLSLLTFGAASSAAHHEAAMNEPRPLVITNS